LLRLPDIAADPRSAGLPPNHPPMRTFLGAPIRAHGRVFGNIYLTDKQAAPEFTEDDEATRSCMRSCSNANAGWTRCARWRRRCSPVTPPAPRWNW
jgi:hypothetical protein